MRYSNDLFEGVKTFFREHVKLGKAVVLVLLFLGLALCWNLGKRYEQSESSKKYVSIPKTEADFTDNFGYLAITELDKNTEAENAAAINLSEYQNVVELTAGGDYVLTGSLSGSVHIAAKEQNVHLFLDNLEIISKSGPAIYCEEADKLVITLVDGSKNTISDSGDYRQYDELEACIYAECDMTVNGTGSLSVSGFYKDAIRSKDIVKILDGELIIKCKRTAVHGNDGILVNGGMIYISSEKNGLKTTKKGAEGRGVLMISGGELSIIAGRYAFVTTKADMYIYNCTVYNKSILGTYDCGGFHRVQEGCVR